MVFTMLASPVTIGLASLLTSLIIALVAHKILRNRWLYAEYKRLSKGIPFLDDFSPLTTHITRFLLSRGNCRKLQRAHKKLGPYVGYLVGERLYLSTTDLDLMKKIVIDEADLHLDKMSLDLPAGEYEESILLAPKDKWRPVRRVFAPAFRPNKFKAPNVVQEIEQSIGKLICYIEDRLERAVALRKQNQGRTEIEVDETIHRYTLNLIFSCFYKQYNLIDFNASVCAWSSAIDGMMNDIRASTMLKLSMIFPWVRPAIDWFVWHFHKHGRTRRNILEFVELQLELGMEARRSSGSDNKTDKLLLKDGTLYRRNIIDHIIDAFEEGKISKSDYFNSSAFLLMAADKTTTDCIVQTIYLLSVNPQVQERLRASIMVDGADSEYLNWVLHESMRLLPPSPGGCARVVSYPVNLSGGGKSPDYVIPANTYLAINAYVIHRLKEYWGQDADEFRPERWADTSHHHPVQFIAFGAGPRGCLGREFALFTMRSVFTALLTRYKFEGKPREDAYDVTSPAMIFNQPNSATNVTISRLIQNEYKM